MVIYTVKAIDAEKAFDKINTFLLFKKKTLNKLGIDGNFLNMIKRRLPNTHD